MKLISDRQIDEDLVRKTAMGDQKAFEELFRLYYTRLCQFAFLILHSKERSEEVVSDVFFTVWVKREHLAPERNFRSFLYTSVRNHAINCLHRDSPIHFHDNINVYELEMKNPETSADDSLDWELFRNHLQHAFDHLPERCRMISRMYFNDQLQYKEIAEILALSRKTVEAQIAIATHKIKEIFEKFGWGRC